MDSYRVETWCEGQPERERERGRRGEREAQREKESEKSGRVTLTSRLPN